MRNLSLYSSFPDCYDRTLGFPVRGFPNRASNEIRNVHNRDNLCPHDERARIHTTRERPIDVEEYEALDFHCGTTFEDLSKPNDGIMRLYAL